MRKYLSLTRVLLKNTMGMLADGKSKKGFQVILYGILVIACLPMVGLLYLLFSSLFEAMQPLHQTGLVIAVGFHMANFITFFFSIFLVPSIFYFSKDTETLLGLPLKPQTILASKFTVALVYEYVFTLAIILPMFTAFLKLHDVSPVLLLNILLIVLSLPIFPLILSSLITMLIMRFVPFFKNRDRFNLIAGILGVAFALGFSMMTNNSSMQQTEMNDIVNLLMQNDSLVGMLGYLFPTVPFAARAVSQADFLQILIYLAIVAAALVVFLTLGKFFYFKGAIGFNETGSNRKALSESGMSKATKQKNKLSTYVRKEFKLLIRTPIYLMNCLGTAAIMPIVFVIMYTTTGSELNLSALQAYSFDGLTPYAILVGLALGLFFANMNLISSTAISREGSNYVFMKYIPMQLSAQIEAKTITGIIVSVISTLVMVIVAYVIFPYLPLLDYVVCFLASIITAILGNYIGILIDMMHPKLVWEQEAAAVKQNMAGVIAMMGGMALCAILGFVIYKLPFDNIMISAAILVVICIVLAFLFRMIAVKKASYFFERM